MERRERPERRRRRIRSARRLALLDQVLATLRDSTRFLTTVEIEDALRRRFCYSDIFSVLQHLHEEGQVAKIRHPLIRNVLWGLMSKQRGFEFDYVLLRKAHADIKIALARAPEPAGRGQWMTKYRAWWEGERREALDA
jgi:hypothetical protein